MSEFGSENAYPSTSVLDRLRKNAIWCFAGGFALALLRLPFARIPVVAFVAGGVVCAIGIGWLMANNPTNRKIGIFIIVVGVLQILSRIPVPHVMLFSNTVLGIVTMWLLVTGVRNVISYFVTQGKRYS